MFRIPHYFKQHNLSWHRTPCYVNTVSSDNALTWLPRILGPEVMQPMSQLHVLWTATTQGSDWIWMNAISRLLVHAVITQQIINPRRFMESINVNLWGNITYFTPRWYNSGILTWQSRKSCAVVGQVHSWKLRGVVISHSFAFRESRRLDFSYKSIENACTAFPSTLVSMLELSPPLLSLLLLRVGGLSSLNTRAILVWGNLQIFKVWYSAVQ
jgi:hypothetical protein